jgi:hypothetical protein
MKTKIERLRKLVEGTAEIQDRYNKATKLVDEILRDIIGGEEIPKNVEPIPVLIYQGLFSEVLDLNNFLEGDK